MSATPLPSPTTIAHRADDARRWLLLAAVLAAFYPFALVPESLLLRTLRPEIGFYLPNYETIHLAARLLLLFGLAVLGLRQVRLRSVPALLILIHAAMVLLAAAVHGDPDGAAFLWIGPQERGDGVFYHLSLALFGLVFVTALRRRPGAARTLGGALLAAGVLEALVVLLQRMGFDPIGPLTRGSAYSFAAGTFSHPGFVAGFLLVVALVAGMASIEGKEGRRWILLAVALLAALALGATGNRSSLAAMVGAVGVRVLLGPRRIPILLLGVALTGGALIGNYALPSRGDGSGARAYGSAQTLEVRLAIWELAGRIVRDRPGLLLVGGGSDALRLATLQDVPSSALLPVVELELGGERFRIVDSRRESLGPRVRDAQMVLTMRDVATGEEVERVYSFTLDRAHNLILDRLLAFGLLDALAWIVLYGGALVAAWRRWWDARVRTVAPAVLATFGYYLFWFPVPQVEPYHLGLVLALWALALPDRDAGSTDPRAQGVSSLQGATG